MSKDGNIEAFIVTGPLAGSLENTSAGEPATKEFACKPAPPCTTAKG